MAAIRSQARSIWGGLLSLFITQAALGTGQPLAPTNPPTDVTKQTLFSIPFYLTPNAPPPTEVHLYVSGDRGKTWSLYQRRQPQQAKFDFQAGKDGEYWFVVRTNEDRNIPDASTRPEKIVLVDRANPELQVNVSFGATGELIARYLAKDANLNPTSLRLEYRLTDAEPWQPIPVDRHPPSETVVSSSLEGETSWAVAQGPGTIRIRGEVSDRAGNRGTFEDAVDLNRMVTNASSSPASTPVTTPAAVPQPTTAPSTDPFSTETNRLPWLSQSQEGSPGRPETSTGWRTLDSSGWPARRLDPSAEPAASGRSPAERSGETYESPTGPPASPDSRFSGRPVAADGLGDTYAPPVANRMVTAASPPRPDVQMTNSRRFNLDYEVAGNGSMDVARVELWITYDEGITWQPFGLDRDLQSPFLVELDREGTFGFRLLVHLLDGISARPPQPGDAADLTIRLDWTPPRAKLLKATVVSAAQATTRTGATVDITWQAEDEFLAERPIRLSYAPSVDGPWSLIAADLPNTGAYQWIHDQPLPARTYIKLEVHDQAGNVATDSLTEPIGVGSGPRGILRGIRPVTESATPQAGS